MLNNGDETVVDYHYKVVLIGEAAVGKTSLQRRYLGKGFESSHIMTLGADFSLKDVKISSGNILRMQLWDIAGQDLFQSIRAQFLGGTAAAIVVYDLTRIETFVKMELWLNELWDANKKNDLPLLIIGNKVDLEKEREVTQELIIAFVEKLRSHPTRKSSFVEYIETSAKTGENVVDAFDSLANGTFELLA